MARVVYYRDGRGVVSLPGTAPRDIKGALQTAAQLVCAEAQGHEHWGGSWTVGQRVATMRCQGCGQTAVVTRLAHCLVVDSFLHMPCSPSGCPADRQHARILRR